MKIKLVKHINNSANSGGGLAFFVVLVGLGLFLKFFWILTLITYLFFLAVAPATTLSWTLTAACLVIGEQLMKIPVKYAIPLALGTLMLAAIFKSSFSKRKATDPQPCTVGHHDPEIIGD